VTLADELTKRGQLESVDGLSYLISLDEGLPEIVNLESYVRIVKDKALLRETMFACQKIIDQCALASEPSTEILETGAAVLESVRNKAEDKRGQWVTAAELLGRNVDSVLFPARGSIGLKTPWPRLTEMTSGMESGRSGHRSGAAQHGEVGDRHAAGAYHCRSGRRRCLLFARDVQGIAGAPLNCRHQPRRRASRTLPVYQH